MIDNFVCLSTVNSLLHCYLALCKVSTQQADSWVLSDWAKLTANNGVMFIWGSTWHSVNLHVPLLQDLLFSGKQTPKNTMGRFCIVSWNMLSVLNKRVIIAVIVSRTIWSSSTWNDMQALVILPFTGAFWNATAVTF